MLEDVISVLNISDNMIRIYGPLGTPPVELVKLGFRKERFGNKTAQTRI